MSSVYVNFFPNFLIIQRWSSINTVALCKQYKWLIHHTSLTYLINSLNLVEFSANLFAWRRVALRSITSFSTFWLFSSNFCFCNSNLLRFLASLSFFRALNRSSLFFISPAIFSFLACIFFLTLSSAFNILRDWTDKTCFLHRSSLLSSSAFSDKTFEWLREFPLKIFHEIV